MTPNKSSRQPCIVIESNQVGMQMMKSSGGPICHIGKLIRVLSAGGINIIVATDGMPCFNTKRATAKRAAKREHAKIMALKLKAELAVLLHDNNQQNDRIQELQKSIQSLEGSFDDVLPDNFTDLLAKHVEYLQGLGLRSTK